MTMGMFWLWMGCSFAVGSVFGAAVLMYLAVEASNR